MPKVLLYEDGKSLFATENHQVSAYILYKYEAGYVYD